MGCDRCCGRYHRWVHVGHRWADHGQRAGIVTGADPLSGDLHEHARERDGER